LVSFVQLSGCSQRKVNFGAYLEIVGSKHMYEPTKLSFTFTVEDRSNPIIPFAIYYDPYVLYFLSCFKNAFIYADCGFFLDTISDTHLKTIYQWVSIENL